MLYSAPYRGDCGQPVSARASIGSILALLWLGLAASAAEPSPAAPVVEGFHHTLIEVMRDADALGFEGRRARLAPAVEATFDLGYISRLVLGSHWGELGEAERARMVEAFTALTIATYAERFDGYSGEHFETVETRKLKRDAELVRTVLVKADGERVRLDYVLHRTPAGWRVINVLADGVSEIAIKRADYDRVLRDQGFDALIERIDEQRKRLGKPS